MSGLKNWAFAPFIEMKAGDAVQVDGEEVYPISGYGAFFDNVDHGGDLIRPGAFRKAVAAFNRKANPEWPDMYLEHRLGGGVHGMLPVGAWTALSEDEKGLRVEGHLASSSTGRDVVALLKMRPRSPLRGLSIGYFAEKAEWVKNPKVGGPQRILSSVDLFEISIVTRPMNPLARIEGAKGELAEKLRTAVMAAGLPHEDAERLLADGLKGLAPPPQRDGPTPPGPRSAALLDALRRMDSTIPD